jgi:Rrf2 family cysteine metabolism transcriptional repressor
MKFGVGVDYSLKALLMLADRYPSVQPLRVEEIAAVQGVPENYLRRLLIELKRGGLVLSQKGPSGGYMLARSPARITMADVVEIIEGGYTPVE